ncbi:putative stage IV sporulation protein YqfD [Clostridium tepidiprofundi DSM 19306]|uniref:Putative stage IV sporulation protein YqfD n=1 Tax=Clostridium tepidiprofundi DSM 19306 TaxID=1121338 RepID=A0A151B408_9CLOT|nr:sporulation protein YqfD [Clostridium tepidiprofundi]KYH34530.1 putative stage IV sporulation protein YqfD [Clostridium tepidiprofundi DSM 19306]
MIKMSNNKTINKGIVIIEITAINPDSFVNILWRNGIEIKRVHKENICTYTMQINACDLKKVESIAENYGVKVSVLKKYGVKFIILRYRKRKAFLFGSILFILMIYYLASFIWSVNIDTEYNISPYEIRKELLTWGIHPGISKRKIDIFEIEDRLMRENDEIVWAKVRVEGTHLHIKISERQTPPNLIKDDTPCNLVANRDGEIIRVYTKAGTAVVSEGDMVRKGEILVNGRQGSEGAEYLVHADGKVIAKTFYEKSKILKSYKIIRKRTGKKSRKVYFTVLGKKIFIKNDLNNFKNYDKIINNTLFFKNEIYYEVEEEREEIEDCDDMIQGAFKELYDDITVNFDKSVKIVDKIKDVKFDGDKYKIRLVVVVEENIAVPQKIEYVDED